MWGGKTVLLFLLLFFCLEVEKGIAVGKESSESFSLVSVCLVLVFKLRSLEYVASGLLASRSGTGFCVEVLDSSIMQSTF